MSAPDEFNLEEYVMHHIRDSDTWHLPFLPPIELPGFLSLHGLMLILCSVFLILTFCVFYPKTPAAPKGLANALEAMILFVRDQIAVPSLGAEDGRRFTPLLCTFFFFILGLNLMGMIPVFSTATANVNVTGGLAFVTLTMMTVGAMVKNGVRGFFKALAPAGVPWPILLLIVPIELIGLLIKSFALMIRLFANMLAGHIVILSILGMVIMVGALATLPAVILALAISILEILVAFLQAYIFTLLSAIFMGLVYHPDH